MRRIDRAGRGAGFRKGRGAAATLAAMLCMAALLSGCVSPRDALGTSSSPCYKAIPVASEAVRDRGTLAGVRLESKSVINRYKRLSALLDAKAGHPVQSVCVASFHGQYQLNQVEDPLGRAPDGGTGKVAIVVVTYPDNILIGTFVFTREPLPLRHEVIGVRPAVAGARRPPT